MSTRFNKPKNLRYQIILDEESSDQLELLKEYSGYKRMKNNMVVSKAIEIWFEMELASKNNQKLNLEWQKIQRSRNRKIVEFKIKDK